jgi:hypothetical protein
MTAKKGFKRHVRDRANKTGESYTAALAYLRHRPDWEQPVSDLEVLDQGGHFQRAARFM